MLPHVWVGDSTSCVKLDSNILSQKLLEIGVLPVKVAQFMSSRLKSPRINTGLDRVVVVAR